MQSSAGREAAAATGSAPPAARSGSGGNRPRSRASARSGSGGSGGGAGLQPLQAKLQQHIDREDRRIKELTEGILYDFFPLALQAALPPGADPASGLSPEAARSVAAAALAVATLMNAPPGFLEFLLCVPWADLGPLYLRSPDQRPNLEGIMGSSGGGGGGAEQPHGAGAGAVPQLLTGQAERAALVNARLDPGLMDCVLDFLYREQHQESLPPMIKLTPPSAVEERVKSADEPGAVSRETVAALLDGATPLHCAAIRGNPAQVDHLLLCGADPLLPNAAGELPLEVVPVCGDRCLGNGKLSCRCMGARDQEAWECRSRLARTLILRRCVVQFRNGLAAWFRVAMLCLLCLLGLWGNHTTLHRPTIDAHAARQAEQRRKRLLKRTQATLLLMRCNAASGRQALGSGGAEAAARSEPPDPHKARGGGGGSVGDALDATLQAGGDAATSSRGGSGGGGGRCDSSQAADHAYNCYSQAVKLLEELELRPGSVPSGFVEAATDTERMPHRCVFPDEQAAIYCGWAEAALRKARSCGCTGCAALALHAVATGQKQVAGLLASPDLSGLEQQERVARVGGAMAGLVHCKAVLLLQTDVRASATRAGVWRAQQCLQEWERLRALGMTAGLGEDEGLDLLCLDAWCRSAASDILLLEALQGAPLLPLQPLAEVLPAAVAFDPASGVPALLRPAGRDVAQQLVAALAAARPHASDHIVRVAEAVAGNLQAEISAGDRLRDLLQPRSGGMGVDELADAIRAAERYLSLAAEVEAARGLKERWIKRAEAQAQFDAAVERLSGPPAAPLLSRPPGAAAPAIAAAAFWAELNGRVAELEGATEEARQANIGVARAKRVLKELQAQGAAVEAAARLDEALLQPRCSSAALKSALAKAEAAAVAAAPGACQFAVGAEMLQPRIQAAKAKLDGEKAAEGLARAAASCKAVADLPRLEAAILAARKVGAQELDPEAYRAASELRLRLDGASRARGALEAALRNLQKLGRQDDADAVERGIEEAEQCGELLLPEAARAREELHRWRVAAAAEARLTRALRDGVGTSQLSRAIKEAAAAGCKVGEARRMLKLMQGLEAAMQQAAEGPLQYQALKARIEQAEAGGCPEALVSDAKRQLHRLLLAEVKAELEAVLKLGRGAEKSVAQRLSSLKAVLDKAGVVLAMDEEQQQQAAMAAAAAAGAAGSTASATETSEAGATDATAASGSGLAPGESSGSLPSGRLLSPTSLDSLSAAAAAAAAAASVYVSAAPSISLEADLAGDADVAVSILLEPLGDDSIQLSVLLPAAAEAEGSGGGSAEEEGSESEGELPAELAGDDLAVVKHMARQARRQLACEEAEQARIERERQEEAQLRREQQLREKAERERADRERAEKAKAERAERKAALEAAKAERRERERQQRLEKERQRQEREKLAKEHFALLQKQRRLQQVVAQAAQAQVLLPPDVATAAAAAGLVPPAPLGLPAQQGLAPAGGLFGAPMPPASADVPAPASALELWAAANAGSAAAGYAALPGLLQQVQQAQHDRSDSLERLSEQQGLLELLNDHPLEPPATQAAPLGSGSGGAPDVSEPAPGGEPLRSPAATTVSDGWEPPQASRAGGGGGPSLGVPAFGSGRWSSMEGSLEGLQGGGAESLAPSASGTPDQSPIKTAPGLAATVAGGGRAASGGSRFLDFGSSLWLGGSSAGGGAAGAGARAATAGGQSGWSSLDQPQQQALSGSGPGLLWGSTGNLSAAAANSPGRPTAQDDLALPGLGSSRLWQPAGGSAGGDGWDQLLGSATGAGASHHGVGGSLLTSPQRLGAAPPPGSAPMASLSGAAAVALLQQRRQAQLIAALDAAKMQLLLQQQAQQRGQQQGQGRQVCKYFVDGFCREGDNCRFAHVLPAGMGGSLRPSGLDPQQQQHLLTLQRLSAGGGPGSGFDGGPHSQQQQQQQQQPGAGGVLSFGAPGAAAFAGSSGAAGSTGGSRPGTPDIRLAGGAPQAGGSAAGMALLQRTSGGPAGSGSGFSVAAPVFSPRDPMGASGAGGYPPTSGGMPGYGAHMGAGGVPLDPYGAGAYGGSRPSSAANSAFATPRDDPRLSAEAESFEDAGEEMGEEGDYESGYYEGGAGEEEHSGLQGGLYHDPYSTHHHHQHHQAAGGPFGGYAMVLEHPPHRHAGGYGGGEQVVVGGKGAEAREERRGQADEEEEEEEEEEWGDVAEGSQRDSYGLPSEASLFGDLPDFLRDTTDE